MAEVSGKDGKVIIGTEVVAGIKSWTLDYTSDALETTNFDDSGHRTYIAGLDGWSGSFEGNRDGAPISQGSLVTLELAITPATTEKYTGSAIITGSHPAVAVDGVASISYDFQGSGPLTVPTT